MSLVLLDTLYKISVIGIILTLIFQYIQSNFGINIDRINRKSEHIVLSDDVKKIINEEFKPRKHEKTKSKDEIIKYLKNELSGMDIHQVKEFLSNMNYLLGISAPSSSKKFISSGRHVILCTFKDKIFDNVLDIGDYIMDADGLPGVNIL